MGFFSKLFGSSSRQTVPVSVEATKSWHYAGEGDCPPPRPLSFVDIPGLCSQDAVGFFNLGIYKVTGYITNPETGRPNKKVKRVSATSAQDAETAAAELGLAPPFTVEVQTDLNAPPNSYQVANAKEYGIEIPLGAVDADVRTMVERSDDHSPSQGFALFCTHILCPKNDCEVLAWLREKTAYTRRLRLIAPSPPVWPSFTPGIRRTASATPP